MNIIYWSYENHLRQVYRLTLIKYDIMHVKMTD